MKRSVADLEVIYSEEAEEWRIEQRRNAARLRQQRWRANNVVVNRNLQARYYAKNADKVRERMRRNYQRKKCQTARKIRELSQRMDESEAR